MGVNIARQVGSDLKGLLSAEELNHLIQGFGDSLTNKAGDETAILTTHGPRLNEILSSRSKKFVNEEKKRGEDFVASFLLRNPRAIKTPSGLVYQEIIAGIGAQVGRHFLRVMFIHS